MYELIIGYIAAFLVTVCMVPQVLQMGKTKLVRDVHLGYVVTLLIGCILMIVYALMINNPVVLSVNIADVIICSIMVYFKKRYENWVK